MPINNDLTVSAYERLSTTPVQDPAGDLGRAQDITYETFYPGGIYGVASMFIPRDVTRPLMLKGGQRLVIRNGLEIVYEGEITGLPAVVRGEDQGIRVDATGYWGALLGRRTLNKPWADVRITEAVFPYDKTVPGAEKCTVDRNSRIRFTPKNVAWADGEYAQVIYTAPTGQTIKRVTFNYDLRDGGQAWNLAVWNVTTGSSPWGVQATGTGTQDLTLATPSQKINLYYQAQAGQTPASDGTIYGEISNIVVYTETGNINMNAIAQDIIDACTDLSTYNTWIIANASPLELAPFITDGHETLSSILTRAAKFGNAAFAAWYTCLLHSEYAASPNGKPVLYAGPTRAMTVYDYAVRFDDLNTQPDFEIGPDYESVYNWIVVHYRDLLDNREIWLTPDDDANLKDTASIATYGQRNYIIEANQATSTMATNYGRRFLASHKDLTYAANSPIKVIGYIRDMYGQPVPVSHIRAGLNIKIENYLDMDYIFTVSRTNYTAEDETCEITCGPLDNSLDVMLAQQDLK